MAAQSNELIDHKNFQGVIFSKTYKNSYYKILEENNRFTPSKKDIELFERNLKKKLTGINKNHLNQTHSCPVIHKKLNNYNRQYLGFIDENGKKYLLINFLWKESEDEKIINAEYYNELGDWKKHWQIIHDGCSHFWNVKYYLTSGELFDLQINGSA